MIRRPPRSTLSSSSAASDVYKRQIRDLSAAFMDYRRVTSPNTARSHASWHLRLDLHRALCVCGLWAGAGMAGPRSSTLDGRTLCHESLHVAGCHAPLCVFGVTGAGGIPSGTVVSVAGCPLRFAGTARHCATGAGIWVDLAL